MLTMLFKETIPTANCFVENGILRTLHLPANSRGTFESVAGLASTTTSRGWTWKGRERAARSTSKMRTVDYRVTRGSPTHGG